LLQMASNEIINGITFVDTAEHTAISKYRTHAPEGGPSVLVVEMPTMRAKFLGNKLMVFAREITFEEHLKRVQNYLSNPEEYYKEHIKSLGQ
jgi:hypothetical protein